MRTLYHEFESLDHLLSTRLLPGGGDEPIRFVVFGGTGAVGGAAILELCMLCLRSERYRDRPFAAEIHATGSSDKEIAHFARRLFLALEPLTRVEKVEPCRHYRVGERIEVYFSLLRLQLPEDLGEHVADQRRLHAADFDLEQTLDDYFEAQPRPFLEFVQGLGPSLLHAVLVAIPLPSIATYALERIDALATAEGLDHRRQQQIKSRYLRTFIRGLAEVQQRHARSVVVAHTTAVGGMYRVDGGTPEIRLGFAHSALGKKLVDKKFFADELTQLYLDQGFDVLVTAAAIGIDSVGFHCHLPLGRAESRALGAAVATALAAGEEPPIAKADLELGTIRLYPARAADLDGPPADATPLRFGAGKDLMVPAAVRSGENGMFSVANCVALYQVMKVAIPEELAMVLVRHAVFGPERRRDWFQDKICFYSETANSQFALRLLANTPELERAHLGTFCPQAFQALGSSTHQARLHELGLLLLVLRLDQLARRFGAVPESELVAGLGDLEEFFWQHTEPPCFEDLELLDAGELARRFGLLCEVDGMEGAGRLLGYDARRHGLREPGRERFLARLATTIQRYLATITSLGIPIVYRRPRGGDRVLLGPYVAPLERALRCADDLAAAFRELASEHGIDEAVARDWTIVNNGFVDLRPHALLSTATEPGRHLAGQVRCFTDADGLAAALGGTRPGTYFTTSGTVALKLRLDRLTAAVTHRQIQLGTLETWKHLFRRTPEGRHQIEPGHVETVRMYSEGLGKVTGTGVLWPSWGY